MKKEKRNLVFIIILNIVLVLYSYFLLYIHPFSDVYPPSKTGSPLWSLTPYITLPFLIFTAIMLDIYIIQNLIKNKKKKT